MYENSIGSLLRTYGRKRARGLSDAKRDVLDNVLDKYRIVLASTKTEDGGVVSEKKVSAISFFLNRFEGECSIGKTVIIEIGFGNGVYLVNEASKHKNTQFIGCEPFENGIAKAVRSIDEMGLQNVLIYPGDSRDLLCRLSDETVDEFCIMFPDPWPKKKHIKRRLLSVDFLRLLYRLLRTGGSIRFASDQLHYVNFVLSNLVEYNAKAGDQKFLIYSSELGFLSQKPCCWSKTKYEQKAINAGEVCYYLRVYK